LDWARSLLRLVNTGSMSAKAPLGAIGNPSEARFPRNELRVLRLQPATNR
jgi:hypothetical protein